MLRVHSALDRQRLGLTDVIPGRVLQRVRDEVAAKDVERLDNVERRLLKLDL